MAFHWTATTIAEDSVQHIKCFLILIPYLVLSFFIYIEISDGAFFPFPPVSLWLNYLSPDFKLSEERSNYYRGFYAEFHFTIKNLV